MKGYLHLFPEKPYGRWVADMWLYSCNANLRLVRSSGQKKKKISRYVQVAIFIHCAKILDRRKSIYFEMSLKRLRFWFRPLLQYSTLEQASFNNVFDYHFLLLAMSVFDLPIQCPLGFATLDKAAALDLATATPLMDLCQYINSNLGYSDLEICLLYSKIATVVVAKSRGWV